MPRPALLRFVLFAGLLALGACSDAAPPPPQFADIRFQDGPPIRLLASTIEFADRFQPKFSPPDVEGDMRGPSPQRAMHNWVADRIRAADPSSSNHIRVTVYDARVVAHALAPKVTGFQASFTDQQNMNYEVYLDMEIVLLDGRGLPLRRVRDTAGASRSLNERATLNDRDQLLYDLTVEATRSLGRRLDGDIVANFAPYIQ